MRPRVLDGGGNLAVAVPGPDSFAAWPPRILFAEKRWGIVVARETEQGDIVAERIKQRAKARHLLAGMRHVSLRRAAPADVGVLAAEFCG